MGNAMHKEFFRSIRRSLGRYLAILAIIALGAGFLAGLQVTKPAMIRTGETYVESQNLFDLQFLSSYGFTQEDVDELKGLPGISAIEGTTFLDVMIRDPEAEKIEDATVKLLSIPHTVNLPSLQAGRMPEKPGEALADAYYYKESDLGKTLVISPENTDSTRDSLAVQELTIVGLCASPLYMNFERGSTTVGNGALSAFLYVPMETFDMDGTYTEINLKLDRNYPMYSEEYDKVIAEQTKELEPIAQKQADRRLDRLRSEGFDQLQEGKLEYQDGLAAFQEEKQKALDQLDEAQLEITNGEIELSRNEQKIKDGEAAIADAEWQLNDGERQIEEGKKTLEQEKIAAYEKMDATEKELLQKRAEVEQGLAQLDAAFPQIEDGLAQINDGLTQVEDGLQQLEAPLKLLDGAILAAQEVLDGINKGLELTPNNPILEASKREAEQNLALLQDQKAELVAQQEAAIVAQAELEAKKAELLETKAQLEAQKAQAQDGLNQIDDGLAALKAARPEAEAQFAAAAQMLEDKKAEIAAGRAELERQRVNLENGKVQLEEGRKALQDGRDEFQKAKAEAMAQLDEAQGELDDAKKQLDDAEQELSKLVPAKAYVLDRDTNVAYVCFESDTDIVAGISKVFPLFFFAVAALVCITTMSKMVDEERTQIGVLKALGYSAGAISQKYLLYSGSASLIGCILGVTFGTIVFPAVIWQGYRIMYNFTEHVTLTFNIWQCLFIVLSFTLTMLAVTWFCCRKELQEVPAELIRPKAPKAGKRLLMERMPFWKHLSFLHKVAMRNIFRYKKRLIMMLVGVGGCTALVVTGLGVRDTIEDIANVQYENVTVYDMETSFSEHQDQRQQNRFLEAVGDHLSGHVFLHESNATIKQDKIQKSVKLLATDQDLDGFMQLDADGTLLGVPGPGEAFISNGLAEVADLKEGDPVTVTTADQEKLELTVAGIFNNHVYHYVVLSEATYQDQLGAAPEINTGYFNVKDGEDLHQTAARISEQKDVLMVMVSQDMQDRVGSMLNSMDYIVALVILSAAMLAFIVIYNLTNINITERIREIATIKVLGFYSRESAAYVFREGMALTLMGCLVGLVAGKFLHAFVISQIRIDIVFFLPQISWLSYGLAILLTLLFAALVDFFLYFKLEHINMAEALKSVE